MPPWSAIKVLLTELAEASKAPDLSRRPKCVPSLGSTISIFSKVESDSLQLRGRRAPAGPQRPGSGCDTPAPRSRASVEMTQHPQLWSILSAHAAYASWWGSEQIPTESGRPHSVLVSCSSDRGRDPWGTSSVPHFSQPTGRVIVLNYSCLSAIPWLLSCYCLPTQGSQVTLVHGCF